MSTLTTSRIRRRTTATSAKTTTTTSTFTKQQLLLLVISLLVVLQEHTTDAQSRLRRKKPSTTTTNPQNNDLASPPLPSPLPVLEESDLHHPRDLLFDDGDIHEKGKPGRGSGIPTPQMRVVGGQTVTSYDKHAYFVEWHNQFCGGALIHDDLVLTAAHCDNAGAIANNLYFRNIKRAESGSVIRSIAAHVTHPNFNAQISTRDYDYLLLKLEKSALVDDDGNPTGVEIIPINTDPGVPAANDELWGMGFGQVGETIGGMSPVLKDATIYAFANQTCERQYRQYFEESYMFCSGVHGGGTDTCQGDSGGPIVDQKTGTLVGVVSFGIGCARPNYAGVNARVSAVSDWLLRSMCEWSNFPKCNGSYAPTPAPTTVGGNGKETAGNNNNNNNNNNSQNGNGNNNIPGSISISITYDDYPEEIAWGLMGPDSSRPLKFQPWKSVITPKSTQTETFDNLQHYITYSFKIADSEGDGICCAYGTGDVVVWDNVRNVELWKTRGNFGPYYEIEFYILPNGHARLTYRGEHYKPATWMDYENMMAPANEPFWPGNVPSSNVSTIMVNVETDDYPEEISWTLHHQSLSPSNLGGWDPIGDWNGAGATFRALISTELKDLKRGWYRFVVRDSEGDGNCCEYGPGYISLTGPLAVTKGQKGLVWGNNGKFWGLDTIYFLVNEFGYISHISKTESTITTGRTISPPETPPLLPLPEPPSEP